MSSLNVNKTVDAWEAIPSLDTTVGALAAAVNEFGLEVVVRLDGSVSLVLPQLPGDGPPTTEELAAVMYGDDDPELIVSEDSGTFTKPTVEEFEAQSFEDEAQDRNAEPA